VIIARSLWRKVCRNVALILKVEAWVFEKGVLEPRSGSIPKPGVGMSNPRPGREKLEPRQRFDHSLPDECAMANSYYAVYEHIVFSTKRREHWLNPEISPELYQYMGGAVNHQGCHSLGVGGTSNHVHLLMRKKSALASADLIKEIKRASSQWLRTKGIAQGKFNWQDGFGAFSISYWDLEKIRAYIVNQDRHHQRMGWEDEIRKLLVKHGIEFDERYVLD
jgi:putative transposase